MSYTPHSERSQTRYSTPEPDLDDHRNQPESLPTVVEPYHGRRRGTLASIASAERPERHESHERTGRPHVDHLELPAMQTYGSIARDFEHAVEDDDKSIKSNKSRRSMRSQRSADEEWHRERRGSQSGQSPIAARRTTFRRAIHNRAREGGQHSRESSSDRSSSPPNSVDAFAPPRPRGRAGTVNSKAVSVDNLTLNRTASIKSKSHRRPTFGEEDGVCVRTDVASIRSSVAEDVCFPPEDPPNTYTIDFEDLEEFIAQPQTRTPVAQPFTSQLHVQHDSAQKRVFHDLRHGHGAHAVPLEEHEALGYDVSADEKKSGLKEKEDEVDSSDEDVQPAVVHAAHHNRFTFFSSEIDESVHAPELGGLLMPDETFRDLFELGPEGGVWWLDMLNPTEEEIFAICGAFRVHPLTREDITAQETREKVELFKSYYFLCFRSFYALDKDSEDYLEPINIYAVVFREGLLTFSFCQNPHAANVRKRISKLRDYVNLSADWICYALIDEIVDAFQPVLRDMERETDTIEDSIFTARFEDSRGILKQINECRKMIVALTRLLGGKADVIKGFAKKCNEAYSVAPRGDVGLYLSDVQDHIVTMMSNLGHFEKILGRSHSNHLAQITLSHTEQGSHANALLGKITVFATILVPLNLMIGLFSMNVPIPGGSATSLHWWFGILGLVLGIPILAAIVFKRLRYF